MDVGFVGLGKMGLPMSRRLLAAGHRLLVHDLDAGRVRLLVDEGAEAAPSPGAIAARVDTVLTSLPSPAALEAVALGRDGIACGEQVRRLVDLSTVGPDATGRLAAALAGHGVALVDAPVSGGVGGAAEGTLAVMVAASAGERAAVEPLLEELGRVFVVGDEPGMGQVMKLANNYLSATALAVTSEALVYGAKAGLDPSVMIDVVNAGSGRNSASEDKFPRAVLPGTFDYGFATALMCKDLRLFAAEAERLGVPLSLGSAVRELWQHTCEQLGEDSDFTEIVRPLEARAGVEVRAHERGVHRGGA
jgi:3-hydroxyisobutyrate dehydrogenase-like beta-hydroxyacid dehydrogenase